MNDKTRANSTYLKKRQENGGGEHQPTYFNRAVLARKFGVVIVQGILLHVIALELT